jgi:hypothetical protein
MNAYQRAALAVGILICTVAPGRAGLQVMGPGISGDYTVSNGTTLWSLVGGVTTTTPPGYNGKNAILRNYVVAVGDGARSVFSLGELDPSFGGTGSPPYIAVTGAGYSLVDPNAGASGRDLSGLTSLEVLAVPALKNGAGGQSASVNLSGLVNAPGAYTLNDLKNDFTPVTETVSGDMYTGVPLYTFINPAASSATSAIVVTGGTDGYEVVVSLAELDPALGGNPNNLLPYADTGGNFPADGVARTIYPTDNKHGRWVSNLNIVNVAAVPEPSTWTMMLLGFAGLGCLATLRTASKLAT